MSQLLVAQRALTVPGWAKDALWRRAQAIPSLDLRFADSKSLVDATTGSNLVTFTRASSGTFVGSDGVLQTAVTNAPRFDHNPTTGESLGLLVEEARTNLLVRSEEFDNASWGKPQSDTVTANSIASPAGATTADSFVENTASGATHTLFQDGTIVANSANTFSCFFKSAGRTQVAIKLSSTDDAHGCVATFDLSAGTVSAVTNYGTGSGSSASVQTFPSGWYRCVISGNIGSSLTTARIRLRPLSGGNETYTGNGTAAYYLWGAQLEAGAFATSYIPTTTATVTRSADVCSITGTAFSSWYRQDEGTVFASSALIASSYTSGVLWDVGASGAFGTTAYGTWSGTQWTLNPNSAPLNMFCTVTAPAQSASAYALKANDSSIAAAGLIGTLDASCAMPASATTLSIGKAGWTAGNYFNGTIRHLTYWPTRLANSVLQNITQ